MNLRKLHCQVLGLSEGASTNEIRRAFRKLALQYHPDRCGSDPAAGEKFRRIHEAYRFLTYNQEKLIGGKSPWQKAASRTKIEPAQEPVPESKKKRPLAFLLLKGREYLSWAAIASALFQTLPRKTKLLMLSVAGASAVAVVTQQLGVTLPAPSSSAPAETSSAPSGQANPSKECKFSGFVDEKYADLTLGTLSQEACREQSERFLKRTAGGGGKCIWGGDVVFDISGDKTEQCNISKAGENLRAKLGPVDGQELQTWWTTLKNCSSRCEENLRNLPLDIFARCDWGSDLLRQQGTYPQPAVGENSKNVNTAYSNHSNASQGDGSQVEDSNRPPAEQNSNGLDARQPAGRPAGFSGFNDTNKRISGQGAESELGGKSGKIDYQQLLFEAALEGNVENANTALKHHANVNAKSAEGYTALHYALDGEKQELFYFLMLHGADVDATDKDGHTPMMFVAANKLDMKYASALVNPGGADVDYKNKKGESAASIAKANGYRELFDYLESDQVVVDFNQAQADIKKRMSSPKR